MKMKNKQNDPKRLLCIVGTMNVGGAETFLMKVYRAIDRTKYQMDFYVSIQEEGFYDEEILSMGGKIFRSVPKTKNPVKSFWKILAIVKQEKYKSVLRISEHSLSALDLVASKIGGAEKLIFRSNNTSTGGGRLNQIAHKVFKWMPITLTTHRIAPSTEAAEFMFGRKCVNSGKATIIKNAIDLNRFQYDSQKRKVMREKYGIDNKLVVGHVGRFHRQKNHAFLLNVFASMNKVNSESVLLLIGEGELENDIRHMVDRLGVNKDVIFAGVSNNVPELMMAMDVFVFPSYFEGMPNVVIEAQATGLPCIISDSITREVKITDAVTFVSLSESEAVWAELILKHSNFMLRKNIIDRFVECGYDIHAVAKKIESDFY
ncbi:MAG: glycosyltransferase family 1 protein [Bacillota bacterium]|nr:glycosyltransferase family 1 protein [Bacillota bacterium]MDW7676577.1 glycosyltransferase family 1 protein [Bacillota bacterium]